MTRTNAGHVEQGQKDKLTVYYNGACPVCRAEMTHYKEKTKDRADEFVWCDASVDPEGAAKAGLDWETSLRRLHVQQGSAPLYVGFDAMLAVWRRLPGYIWLARFFSVAGIYPVSAWIYEHIVSALLYRWSKARGAGRPGGRA